MNATAPTIRSSGTRAVTKPRLGFLGVGWIGANRLGALARSGLVEVSALADPVREAAERRRSTRPKQFGSAN